MPTTPTSSLYDLVALLAAHHWLPLIAFLALYLRKLSSDESSFPLTIPPQWRSTISAAGGLVYGFVGALQSGTPLGAAVIGAVVAAASAGFLDGMLTAIFNHNNAPAWARAIVMVFDDIAGGGTMNKKTTTVETTKATIVEIKETPVPEASPSSAPTTPGGVDKKIPSLPPPTSTVRKTLMFPKTLKLLILGSLFPLGLGACLKPGQTLPPEIPSDIAKIISCVATDVIAGAQPSTMLTDCGVATLEDLWSILKQLYLSKEFAAKHPEAQSNLSIRLQQAEIGAAVERAKRK
jgi:hypothetical protein